MGVVGQDIGSWEGWSVSLLEILTVEPNRPRNTETPVSISIGFRQSWLIATTEVAYSNSLDNCLGFMGVCWTPVLVFNAKRPQIANSRTLPVPVIVRQPSRGAARLTLEGVGSYGAGDW